MPKIGLREQFDMTTRNQYTKVDCEIGLSVNGRELPSMAVLGDALEKAIEMIQNAITESYKVVPPRDVEVPVAQPVAATASISSVPQPAPVAPQPEPEKPMTTFG